MFRRKGKIRKCIVFTLMISLLAGMISAPEQMASAAGGKKGSSINAAGHIRTAIESPAQTATGPASGESAGKPAQTATGPVIETPTAKPAQTATGPVIETPMAKPTQTATGSVIETPTAKPTQTATSSPIQTPTASQAPTPVPIPAVTPKPNANIMLGDPINNVILTIGTGGEFDIDRNAAAIYPNDLLSQVVRISYMADNPETLTVTESGKYEAIQVGTAYLRVTGYGMDGGILSDRIYIVLVYPDMTDVTLSADSLDLYIDRRADNGASDSVKIKSAYTFDENTENFDLKVDSSNEDMDVYVNIYNNEVVITCDNVGTTKLTIALYGKIFTVHLKVYSVGISNTSLLMATHASKKIKVKGYSGSLEWKSSRPAVASISNAGKIKAKKEGNTVISAKLGTIRFGCILSVTSSRKKKAVNRAKSIASTSKYSQPKRMRQGYYDCSSLVWRAYAPYGYRFGDSSYAPTAASEAYYLAVRNKIYGKFNKKNVENLKINAGDLLFRTGAKNGRYKGIYHVEMIAGYEFVGWKTNGKPEVLVKWANRTDGYYSYGAGIVGKV